VLCHRVGHVLEDCDKNFVKRFQGDLQGSAKVHDPSSPCSGQKVVLEPSPSPRQGRGHGAVPKPNELHQENVGLVVGDMKIPLSEFDSRFRIYCFSKDLVVEDINLTTS
jgi:hypothetical protein